MCDHAPAGYRGWADRIAERLASDSTEFRYANLAVRGKLVGQIADEKADIAARMRPMLASFAGGLNDVMRPRCDMNLVCATVERTVETLARTGAKVVLFRPIDPTRRMRGSARLMPRIDRLLETVSGVGERHGAAIVDLFSARVFDDPRLWAEDRIHLSQEGHRRVAEAVGQAVGLPARFDWSAPLPPAPHMPLWERARADLRWAAVYVGPWIGRRLTGRSSGDGRTAKRPDLSPLD